MPPPAAAEAPGAAEPSPDTSIDLALVNVKLEPVEDLKFTVNTLGGDPFNFDPGARDQNW